MVRFLACLQPVRPSPVTADVPRLNHPLTQLRHLHLSVNPYSSTEHSDASQYSTRRPRVSRIVRIAIYTHLVAVALTGLAMTHDSRTVIWSKQWEPLLELGLVVGTLAIIVCPILAVVGALRSAVPGATRLKWLIVECAVVLAHFVALIPGVQ